MDLMLLLTCRAFLAEEKKGSSIADDFCLVSGGSHQPNLRHQCNLRNKVWILLKLLLKFPADFQAMLLLFILQQPWHKLPRNPPHVQFL
jgi:hypothetical protein